MWDKKVYENVKKNCMDSINKEIDPISYWVDVYHIMIEAECYEGAKAIDEILTLMQIEFL